MEVFVCFNADMISFVNHVLSCCHPNTLHGDECLMLAFEFISSFDFVHAFVFVFVFVFAFAFI